MNFEMRLNLWPILAASLLPIFVTPVHAAPQFIVFEPKGHAKGKNIVLISGDEEYRSEEMLPQLAKILSTYHGFRCTVLFAIDPKTGNVDPDRLDNIPGLEALDSADLMVLFTRFRDLPDDQMKHILNYVESGKPIIGLRTATHAFALKSSTTYARYSWNDPDGGFGRMIFGETWINHWGKHGKQSTRGVINANEAGHPILKGIDKNGLWSTTDVYRMGEELHRRRGQDLPSFRDHDGDSARSLAGERPSTTCKCVLLGTRPGERDQSKIERQLSRGISPRSVRIRRVCKRPDSGILHRTLTYSLLERLNFD